jgi:hypothetical protein
MLEKLENQLVGDANGVFDVDPKTGFLPPQAPVVRLPAQWDEWERTLDNAVAARLQPGDKVGLTTDQMKTSERWRAQVRQVRFYLSTLLSVVADGDV